ncbi:hypothetical protein CPC08DRAFT_706023 [Agrocybe pediades]|nr:hypothetical protein CPC08DRAFT_706023 [Agrocybe pediades]
MDIYPEEAAPQELSAGLSYDDTIAYEAQLPTEAERAATEADMSSSFASRISRSKVYLLEDSSTSATRTGTSGKRKHGGEGEDAEVAEMEDEEMDPDSIYRGNAIFLNGSPIAHLPTARIFAYAKHFDAYPFGLEWVNDNTCVLVFERRKEAQKAFSRLQKSADEQPDMDDCITARAFPVALWPPEERINETLGKGPGLKGVIRMRWARRDDVKKKGAMKESQFYRKHGSTAGKELYDGRDMPPPKRRRRDDVDDDARRAQLDDELDQFLAEDNSDEEKARTLDVLPEDAAEDDVPASPPSKMRSDYIATDGRTLLERTSLIRVHDSDEVRLDLASRITAPLPRRSRQPRGRGGARDGFAATVEDAADLSYQTLSDRLQPPTTEKLEWGPDQSERRRNGRERDGLRINGASESDDRRRRRRGGGGDRDRERERERDGERERRPARGTRTAERPRKTQQELDDELDAFLRGS